MTSLNSQNAVSRLLSSASFKGKDPSFLQRFTRTNTITERNKQEKAPSLYAEQVGPCINQIPEEGIAIRTPGEYYFDRNLTWTPNPQTAGSAILVFSSDVVLNMNGFTLTVNAPANSTLPFNGIGIGMIDGDKHIFNNITLKKGTIRGATYYGVNSLQILGLTLEDINVDGLAYKETSVPDLTPCGIFLNKTEGFSISNCTVSNITVTAPSCAGLQIVSSCAGKVYNCIMQDFLNNDGGVQGYSYLESFDILTDGCVSQRFRSHYLGLTNTTGHTVIGYVPIGCFDLKFNGCRATEMTGCCDDCHGMSVFIDMDVEVTNFRAYKILDGDCPVNTGAKATGLEVYGDNIRITDCHVEDIKAIVPQDLQSTGFSAWGSGNSFTNCTARNVLVLDANRQPTDQHGYGTGFGWAPDPRGPQDGDYDFNCTPANQTTYTNCLVYDSPLGFDTWFHTNSVWRQIMTYGCRIMLLAQPKGTPRTLKMDRCSESPSGNPESVTIYNIAENNEYPEVIVT